MSFWEPQASLSPGKRHLTKTVLWGFPSPILWVFRRHPHCISSTYQLDWYSQLRGHMHCCMAWIINCSLFASQSMLHTFTELVCNNRQLIRLRLSLWARRLKISLSQKTGEARNDWDTPFMVHDQRTVKHYSSNWQTVTRETKSDIVWRFPDNCLFSADKILTCNAKSTDPWRL